MEGLNNKDFYYSEYLDKNRELDGYLLRQEFLFDNGYDIEKDIWDTPVTVLEVLVAMSKRIETEITGDLGNDHIEKWFWVMIGNLGLNLYVDERYDDNKINEILDIWLMREFDRDGTGSIFPLKNCPNDITKTDMWYQMQLYLSENYQF